MSCNLLQHRPRLSFFVFAFMAIAHRALDLDYHASSSSISHCADKCNQASSSTLCGPFLPFRTSDKVPALRELHDPSPAENADGLPRPPSPRPPSPDCANADNLTVIRIVFVRVERFAIASAVFGLGGRAAEPSSTPASVVRGREHGIRGRALAPRNRRR